MNPLAPPPGAPRPTRRHRGLRIGLVLLLVATVPVMGIGGLTIHAVRAAQAREDDAMHVGDLASHAVALTELDGAIFEEMVWSVVAEVMSSLDAPAALLTAFLDSDPAAEAADAVARTDELLVVVAHPSITAEVATARTGGLDRREIVGRFGQVASSIEAELTSVLAVLGEAPHGATGAVPRSLAMLRLAVDARVSVAGEFSAYFATVLALRDSGPTELRRLIAAQAAYEDDLTSLQTLAGDVAPLATALRALEKEPDLVAFQEVVDGLVTASLTEGIAEVPAELSVASLSAHVAELRTAYGAATHASRLAVALLDATAAVVLDASRSDEAAAHADIVRWYTLASVLALATTASALLASRYIARPLRRLHQAAVDLRTGDGAERDSLDGPAEVRTAALALRDAAAHVDLVTHQADALASGDLDAAVLDQPAPGGLGVALQHAVSNLRVAIAQQDEFQRRLAHEASHDALTRLPNRNASLAHLARSLARSARGESGLAVLVIDVDRFNEVNDHHGHRGGDVVLATIARRLVTTVREGDHVGRLGGDEFVVVAEPVAGVDEAISLAERIVDAIDHPIALPMAAVHVHASVGIAIADAGLTADELLRDADLAVYRAKEAGQGGVVVCNEDLHAEIAETAGLHLAIRNAIDRDELVVHYQPIVDVHTGRLHALEALVRWRRPGDDGLVPPDRFIGVAERSSLIVDLDCWVVAAVARQLAAWSDDPDLGTVPVAVNVSGRHLAHDHVVDQLLRPLAHAGVAPRRMIVEVTESALVGDLQHAAAKLHELRSAGMQVAIDDFGTGYTSLAHLRCLPVDVLKIDRSFTVNATSGEQGASIVKLIIDAGHLLGATVTAEGIETPDEAARLMELGADHLQGFLFARPMPAADIEALHRDTGHVRG